MTDVKVEQCDREAAVKYGLEVMGWNHGVSDAVATGRADDATIVQAFARHRQAAEKAQQERDAGIAEDPRNGLSAWRTRERIATAIRSQGHE